MSDARYAQYRSDAGAEKARFCCAFAFSSYEHREDKPRIHATCNHLILSRPQWRVIAAEMLTDRLAVNDRSKGAAEVVHVITPLALLDHKVVAR